MSLLAIEMNVIGDVCSRFEGSNCDSGCKVGWMGSSCNIPTPYCFGIIASNATVCNSKGSCVSNNTCVCRAGYSGSDCNSACPSSLSHYYPLKSDLLDAVGTNNLKYVSTAPTFSNYAGRMSLYCDSTTNYLSNSIMYWDSSAQVEGKTISVWVNRESGTGIPFGMGNHYYIEFDIAGSNGNAGFTFHDYNNNAILTSPTQYPAGVWKHYVIVFRSDGTDLYVDGSLAKSVTSPVYANSGYFNVCGHTNYFKGHVADFKIFSKVLTSSEVNALYSC